MSSENEESSRQSEEDRSVRSNHSEQEQETLDNLLNSYASSTKHDFKKKPAAAVKQKKITLYRRDQSLKQDNSSESASDQSNREDDEISHNSFNNQNESEFSNIELPDQLPPIVDPEEKPSKDFFCSVPASYQSDTPHHHIPDRPPTNQQIIADQQTIVDQPTYRIQRKAAPGENYGISSLTVISYNIWYHKKDQTTRARNLAKILLNQKHEPDLICLQEVTPRSFKILEQILNQGYFLFEVFGSDEQLPYCNIIAIHRKKLEIVNDTMVAYDFKSQMGRKLMVAEVKHRQTGISLMIMNTHLESQQENWKYRKIQMEAINRLIKEGKEYQNFILVGDFNIHHEREPIETLLRLYNYHDAWDEMGSPQSLKYTYDSQTNPYTQEGQRNKLRSRFDRILYRFLNDRIVVTKMKLLGVQKPISNHYGLLTEFMIKTKNQNGEI